jgi:deoxyribonucleoside regulator
VETDKLKKIIEAAKLYYQLDYSQSEIADALGVSRPTVSRLLQQAKAQGIVNIEIHDPTQDIALLRSRLIDTYDLEDVALAFTPTYDDEIVKRYIGQATAEYLMKLVKDGDTIGASWGSTMYQVALHMHTKPLKHSLVVQLNGGVADADIQISPSEIVHLFGKAFGVVPYFMYLPAIVDETIVKKAIMTDRHIKRVMDMARQANIAVFTAGAPTPDSVLINSNYMKPDELEVIKTRAAGEICSRYYDHNGEICLPALNERTIGIELSELRRKEHAILVAGGASKVNAIDGALKGRYANTLVTDQITAQALLDKSKK